MTARTGPDDPAGMWAAIVRARLALQIGLGFIWIYEGLIPKMLVPLTDLEIGVVAASGLVPNGLEAPLLRVLGGAEILLGILVIWGGWSRPLCVVQFSVVSFFTVLIPATHPSTLVHPFGLLSKNIPILGAIAALWWLADSGRQPADDAVQEHIGAFPNLLKRR